MKPNIDGSEFGSITIAGRRIENDVMIRLDGAVSKRQKKLSKAIYGTSHVISLAEAEVNSGAEALIDTLNHVLTEESPLDELVASRVPADAAPERDLIFLVRAGALFPFYRTSALLERMMGRVKVPSILFFPGRFYSPAGLGFMGVLDPEHNYRARIY